MTHISRSLCILGIAATAFVASAQVQQAGRAVAQTQAPAGNQIRPDYVLGPNDQILIRVPQEEQINERPFRIDQEGNLVLPLVGSLQASGLTVQALETEISNALREYVRDPLVSITVVQFRSDPVFFMGAFVAPGIYPLQGRRTLVEMLAAVGGLQPNASRRIRVIRQAEYGPIPLPNATVDTENQISTVEISLQSLTEDINPEEDIVLQAYDKVVVDRAERIYVNGAVTRVGAIELGERDSMTVSQALTEAGGFAQDAVRDRVTVLRPVLGTNRRAAFEIDMNGIFSGQTVDFPLLQNDMLYVERSGKRSYLVPLSASIISSMPWILVSAIINRN